MTAQQIIDLNAYLTEKGFSRYHRSEIDPERTGYQYDLRHHELNFSVAGPWRDQSYSISIEVYNREHAHHEHALRAMRNRLIGSNRTDACTPERIKEIIEGLLQTSQKDQEDLFNHMTTANKIYAETREQAIEDLLEGIF